MTDDSLHILLCGRILPWVSLLENRTLHRVLHSRQTYWTNWCVLLTCVGGWTAPSTWSTWSTPSRRTWRAKAILEIWARVWGFWNGSLEVILVTSLVFPDLSWAFHVIVSIPLFCRECYHFNLNIVEFIEWRFFVSSNLVELSSTCLHQYTGRPT